MNKFDLSSYSDIFFDCDGVVLNSNEIKTQAFYNVAKVYGHEPAQALKNYHMQNGGISRYKKFEYFLLEILRKPFNQQELDQLLNVFAEEVKNALLTCEMAVGLKELRKKTKYAKWLIVSGGDQEELRDVFARRGLADLFDGGIFGSPDTKDAILARELNIGNIIRTGLFLGDSKYDYQAASAAGLDFVFISQWTEVQDWENWTRSNSLVCSHTLSDLETL